MTARWEPVDAGYAARDLRAPEPAAETSDYYTLVWTVTYFINLFIPLLFGSGCVSGAGTVGMILGIVAAWGVGFVICILRSPWRRALLAGSLVTAASQFLPIAHILAGSLAISTWERLSGQRGEANTLLAGFAITLFTAQIMFVAALIVGWPIVWARDVVLGPNTTESSNTPADGDTDD